jgi:hypothetical protein
MTPTAVKLNGISQWQQLLRNGLLKPSREQHFAVVLLANAHPNAYISCFLILKLPPLYHTICLLLLIKNLTSCTSRDITSPKPPEKTTVKAPSRMPQEPEDPAPYSAPCQQEAAKRPKLHTNSQSSAPNPIIIKKKWGNDRTIMSPFLNWWPFYPQTSFEKLPRINSHALRQPQPYQRLPRMH